MEALWMLTREIENLQKSQELLQRKELALVDRGYRRFFKVVRALPNFLEHSYTYNRYPEDQIDYVRVVDNPLRLEPKAWNDFSKDIYNLGVFNYRLWEYPKKVTKVKTPHYVASIKLVPEPDESAFPTATVINVQYSPEPRESDSFPERRNYIEGLEKLGELDELKKLVLINKLVDKYSEQILLRAQKAS